MPALHLPRVRRLPGWRLLQGKSLFFKYFFTCTAIILLGFLFLGTALTVFSVQYSDSERKKLNLTSAQSISSLTTVMYERSDFDNNQLMVNILGYSQEVLRQATETDYYIVDMNGQVVQNTRQRYTVLSSPNAAVPVSIVKKVTGNPQSVFKNGYYEIGTLGGFFGKTCSTVGVPIFYNGNVIGVVFASSKASNLLHYMYDVIRMFLLCMFGALLFSFVVIYILTARLVRPLNQMSRAAKSFSKGDFSIRIPVDDNDEIGQLAVAFNNMASSLASLEEMRRSFVANVSHELKTPMTSIAGFIDGILDGTIPPEKHSYYLSIVSQEVKRLSRLVRSFLDIARIEAGEMKLSLSQFDVAETARRVVIGFEKQIGEKNLEIAGLDTDRAYLVSADADKTHQVIYNLVENAIKFSSPGGRIEITLVSRDKKVYVGVKNTGMGIPLKDLPYVFERFYKTDKSRSLDRKGVGLGLYIVKSMVDLQGGDISVKSEEGKYCEFVFTLPKAESR